MYKIGTTEIIVFVTTLLAVLATDLIIGIMIGIFCNFFILLTWKVNLTQLFNVRVTEESNELQLNGAYTFSNYLGLKKQIDNALAESELVVLNFTQTTFLDHTTIAHLQGLQKAAAVDGRTLEFSGLEELVPATSHEQSERSRKNG
jgi:MFS superfamily sulfate permease-like transporter